MRLKIIISQEGKCRNEKQQIHGSLLAIILYPNLLPAVNTFYYSHAIFFVTIYQHLVLKIVFRKAAQSQYFC